MHTGPDHFGNLMSGTYADGNRVYWGNGIDRIVKLDFDNYEVIDEYFFPDVTVYTAEQADESIAGFDASNSGLVAMLGGENNALLASSAVQMSFAQLLGFAAFILLLGPLPEEIGWRGYALPALLNRHTALSATLVLGAMWGLWHVPLFFMPGYYEAFGGAPDPALFFGNILIISFFYTWLFLHTKGSILAAVLFHFSVNFSGELIALPDQGEWIKTTILACAVIAIVAYRPDAWTSKPAG